jgi:MOSC domain-containing protein YiiM
VERKVRLKARIISCNLGRTMTLDNAGKQVRTGIFKEPVDGAILLEANGARGDFIADLRVHGGPRKAVYVYPSQHYPWWAEKLGREPLPWGTLGENLTIENIGESKALALDGGGEPVDESTVHIGDRFRVGGALLEVTKPRLPCYKLALKLGTYDVLPWMIERGAFGFYVAVIEPGEVRAGDLMELVSAELEQPTVRDEGRRRSQ